MTEPRLERALEAYLSFCDADPQPAWTDFLADHEDLRDLLEPMHEDEESDEPVGGSSGLHVIGDFQLVGEIGRGGMGVVYRAVQRSVGRTVALKVLPAHLTLDAHAIARFQREATLAGRLDHPGIVEVFTVGSDAGSHFFAMELIEGTSLGDVLAKLRAVAPSGDVSPLTGADVRAAITEGLPAGAPPENGSRGSSLHAPDVFRGGYVETMVAIAAQIAESLRYAHQNDVLHRDVKPSNVMIRGDGRVVLTDFGLAQEESLPSMTLTGHFLGTPHYVAPEQARGDRAALGPAVDVFALGATLYEMVTLHRPFPGDSTVDVLRSIADEEPVNPRRHHRALPQDLVAIVLRALEKSPADRYADAGAFADDLRALVEFRPVVARPTGPLRRTARWIRRNHVATASAALVFISLVAALIVSLGAQREAERAASAARDELAQRQQTVEFLRWVLSSPDPMVLGPDSPLREMLARAGDRIETQFQNQPALRAEIQGMLGDIYVSLDDSDAAQQHLRPALDWMRDQGIRSPERALLAHKLADTLPIQSAATDAVYAEAQGLLEEQFGAQDHRVVHLLCGRARGLLDHGDDDEARELIERAGEIATATGSPQARFDWLRTRARLHMYDARWPAALTDFEAALEVDGLPEGGWQGYQRRMAMKDMLGVAAQNGQPEKGLDASQQLIAYMEGLLGKEDPRLIMAYGNRATLLRWAGDHDAAEAPYTRALEIARAASDGPGADLATALNNLGALYQHQGRYDEAAQLLTEAADMYADVFGENHRSVAGALDILADVHRSRRDYAAAMPIQRRSLTILRKVLGDGHFETMCGFFRTGRLEVRCGEAAAARQHWQTAFPALGELDGYSRDRVLQFAADVRKALAEHGPADLRVEFLLSLATAQQASEYLDDAEQSLREALKSAVDEASSTRVRSAAATFTEATGRPLELR